MRNFMMVGLEFLAGRETGRGAFKCPTCTEAGRRGGRRLRPTFPVQAAAGVQTLHACGLGELAMSADTEPVASTKVLAPVLELSETACQADLLVRRRPAQTTGCVECLSRVASASEQACGKHPLLSDKLTARVTRLCRLSVGRCARHHQGEHASRCGVGAAWPMRCVIASPRLLSHDKTPTPRDRTDNKAACTSVSRSVARPKATNVQCPMVVGSGRPFPRPPDPTMALSALGNSCCNGGLPDGRGRRSREQQPE